MGVRVLFFFRILRFFLGAFPAGNLGPIIRVQKTNGRRLLEKATTFFRDNIFSHSFTVVDKDFVVCCFVSFLLRLYKPPSNGSQAA